MIKKTGLLLSSFFFLFSSSSSYFFVYNCFLKDFLSMPSVPLTLSHLERPKLYEVLAILSTIAL